MLIIAACVLPAIALYIAIGWTLWQDRKAQLADLALQQAQLLAGNVNSIADGARILLSAAEEFRQIRSVGDACNARLAALERKVPSFLFLVYIDAERQIRCTSDNSLLGPADGMISSQDIGAASGFTAGRFTRTDRFPGGYVPFFLPVHAGDGGRVGTLVAALDLTWLEQHLQQLKRDGSPFLASGILTVADAQGVVLARDARHAEFVGKPFPPAAMPLVHAAKPGILRVKSIDGTYRLVAYTPPSPESHNLVAAVGFYEPDLTGDIKRALLQWALLLIATMGAVFVVVSIVARRSIARPTQILAAMAYRWRQGDLSARAPIADGRSQFGQLAAAYNEMAAALQNREAELRAYACAQEAEVAKRTSELVLANQRLQCEMEQRHSAEIALLQGQKMQAVGQLAGGIAHDFNNILQVVSGSASLIQRRAESPDAVQRLSRSLEQAARRGTSITQRLLAFSRREDLRAEILDVKDVISSLRDVLDVTLGVNVGVEVDARDDLPTVKADRGQLETVIINLAANARDAMPRGGTIRIAARLEQTPSTADPSPPPDGSYVSITVSDTGEGMSPDTLARAAEPFFTTKSLGQGTGLGLAMARGFADASGGRLIISSSPGNGTNVSLWLPAISPLTGTDEGTAAQQVGLAQENDGKRPRILLVDDEAVVRSVLADQLSDEGHEILEAEDATSALAIVRSGANLDLLVSDLIMPGMDGLALIAAAKRDRPGLPAILITGYAGNARELVGQRAVEGEFLLLRKPVSGQVLAHHIAELIQSQAHRATALGPGAA